jgi:hypothetical protein
MLGSGKRTVLMNERLFTNTNLRFSLTNGYFAVLRDKTKRHRPYLHIISLGTQAAKQRLRLKETPAKTSQHPSVSKQLPRTGWPTSSQPLYTPRAKQIGLGYW